MSNLSFTVRIRTIWLSIITLLHFQNGSAKNPVCNTEECKQLGRMYKMNIDKHWDPCTNFYKFTCGGFEERYRKSIFHNYWCGESIMEEGVLHSLKKLLEDKKKSPEVDVEQAKSLYRVCLNTPSLPRSQSSVLKKIIAKISPIPMLHPYDKDQSSAPPVWLINKHFIKVSGESAFFSYKILTDENDRNKIVTALKKPIAANGMVARIADWNEQELKSYIDFLLHVLQEVAPEIIKLSRNTLAHDITQVIDFRDKLRKISNAAEPKVIEVMSIRDFQNWYNTYVNFKPNAQINWVEILRAIYRTDHPLSPFAAPTSKIIVNKRYFSKLAELLAQTNRKILVNHMHLFFAERHIQLNDFLESRLKGSFYDGFHETGGVVLDKPRWRKCIEDHNMKETLGKMYLRSYFPQRKQDTVATIFKETKRVLREQIANSNWLVPQVKKMAVDKIEHMKSEIGHPDWYTISALRPQDTTDELNPIEANAYYEPGENRIAVSAACLQLPLCGLDMPYVIDYGAIMSILGHEIYHAFDGKGISCDMHGKQPWWPKNMCIEYSKQMQCFKDQYEGYREEELKKRSFPRPAKFPTTSNEDVADVMGLKLAYIAFKEKLEANGGRCMTLPGFEDYDCEKMFFVAFANTHCTALTSGMKERNLLEDTHSLPEIRVNGAVSNMRQFSSAFGCKSTSPMKLKKTCDIWKK